MTKIFYANADNYMLGVIHYCGRFTCVPLFKVKLTLLRVRTFCSPMYTAQLWWNYTVASIHNLHVAYNNVFRLLLNQPKYCSASTMFVEYHVPDSKAVIRNLVYKFMRRLDASYNKLVLDKNVVYT